MTTSYLGEASLETKYFFDLTPDRILTAAERFGVRCTGRITQLNSLENRVYEVEVELADEPKSPSDRFRVIKFYRPGRWTKEQIAEEHLFLLDLVKAEIPAIAPLLSDTNETVLTFPDIAINFALFPKAGGRSPDELDDESTEQLGRLLARMHLVGASRAATHRIALTPQVYADHNVRFLIESDILPRELHAPYLTLVENLCRFSQPFFDLCAPQRIHGDCHFGNIIIGSQGMCLVDFDDMVVGPAVQDMWLLIPGRDAYAQRKLQLLLSGYEQLKTFDRRTIALIEVLRALRLIHYSAWIARRQHDPFFQRTFPQFGTQQYWREQLADLADQWRVVQQGGFGCAES